jgi:dethiobiotin synthetase/adenosylmethionine--8-amino-7-oxononanoate aminotransferase
VRAAAATDSSAVNYIKPLQCGGSDESFVARHDSRRSQCNITCKTLFNWMTPASPHLASRWENLPVSDEQVTLSLTESMKLIQSSSVKSTTIIETAGGALSPSSSSPDNALTTESRWGWSTQADLYSPLNIPVVFVGDGKLGGISVTLSTLEALWNRGYSVDAVVFINSGTENGQDGNAISFGEGNAEALEEYIMMQTINQAFPCRNIQNFGEDDIVLLSPLPPMPEPLDNWYEQNHERFSKLNHLLNKKWCAYFK